MQDIIPLTKELIRFATMHAKPREIRRCADFIENYLKKCGATPQRFEFQGVPSIAVMPPGGQAPVLLMSHIDVVDAPEELFEPVEKEGKLYGRGSIDDKYAVALSMVLVKNHLARLKKEGRGPEELPFGILVTGDEEIGGENGARAVLGELKTDFCIALDGGGLKKIVVKEKGIVHLKLVARGKTAHGARPWLGENAIEKLIDDYQRLRTHFELSAPDHWHRTLNFSRIQAGKAINQVPDYAEAMFDIRYTENDDIQQIIARIRDEIQGELAVERTEPIFSGGKSAYLDLLRKIAPRAEVGCEHGASDARFLSSYGIDGIVWGADGDSSAHSLDEHVNIDSVEELYRLLDRFLQAVPPSSS